MFGGAMRTELSFEGLGTMESLIWDDVLNHFPVTLIAGVN
jgi:hypothetical protein